MTTIRLPYPPAVLNPNSRVHWTKKAKAAKAYGEECFVSMMCYLVMHREIAREGVRQGILTGHPLRGKTKFSLTFCPPDSRRRDLDNMLASFKSGLDEIARRSGVDDSKFQLTISKGEPVKGGCVIVEVLG